MRDAFTFLHLSDPQFGRNHRFGRLGALEDGSFSLDTLFDRLVADLKIHAQAGVKPDFVVLSGDLVEWGKKSEFDDGLTFLTRLAGCLEIPRERVVLIPGNHDINRDHCESYFKFCQGDSIEPVPPYWPKWKNFATMFGNFYPACAGIEFTEAQPWTFYEFNELKIVVVALNSTMAESHRDDSHFGFIGEKQLAWFSEKLGRYKLEEWFRIGVLHHNVERRAIDDNENLRDREDLVRILGRSLNLVLHGHTHDTATAWLTQHTPIISTGSAALKEAQRPFEVPNQYQLVTVKAAGIERRLRRYENKRWIGDTGPSENGDSWLVSEKISFEGISGALVIGGAANARGPVVQITKSVTAEDAERKLAPLPRLQLRSEEHQRAVRQTEREHLVRILRAKGSAWLVADWLHGKDGFIAAALAELGGADAIQSIFRLQCSVASKCSDIMSGAETQLGLSFPEFSAALAPLPQAYLILDDIPQVIAMGKERDQLEATLRSIFDFCPKLKLILVSRQVPRNTRPEDYVALRPLEVPEVRDYLRLHPKLHDRARSAITPMTIDQIHSWSGGLPMHLDRLIDRLEHINLSEILSEESPAAASPANEPVPDSLVRSYRTLAESEDKMTRRSVRLLKVLTILRDGETYQTIRRFFPQEPFHQNNIDQLIEHSLIDSVAISQSTPTLGLKNTPTIAGHEEPRLLRVQRQVRDYVNTLMVDEERDEIISASMGFLFGAKWFRKVRVRTSIVSAYSQSSLVGPGNEHVVVRLVLSRAIQLGNDKLVKKYLTVFITYCAKLISENRFRDAAIATGAILDLLRTRPGDMQLVELEQQHGHALRMIGDTKEAINALEHAIEVGGDALNDEFRSDILINLALSYQKVDRAADALSSARAIKDLCHEESSNGFHARAVIAELTLEGNELKTALKELEDSARRKNRRTVADNIALELVRDSNDPEEALSMLENVLKTNGDSYNRTRAIIEKAAILGKHLRLSDLHAADYRVLSEAYSYCYSQRFGTLLDRCHRVLWGMCIRERMSSVLLRLFRFSSFVWRLRGEETREQEYLKELDKVDLSKLPESEATGISVEIVYVKRRRMLFADKIVTP